MITGRREARVMLAGIYGTDELETIDSAIQVASGGSSTVSTHLAEYHVLSTLMKNVALGGGVVSFSSEGSSVTRQAVDIQTLEKLRREALRAYAAEMGQSSGLSVIEIVDETPDASFRSDSLRYANDRDRYDYSTSGGREVLRWIHS